MVLWLFFFLSPYWLEVYSEVITDVNDMMSEICFKVPSPTKKKGEGEARRWDKNGKMGTSLMAQWLRILLPMHGIALVREDPTCHVATKAMRHNY